jgi:transcriptional activator cubitus interruptus
VKTVHGAEFYANKKHKGPGDGTEDGSSGAGGLLDSSPHSEEMMSGKTASLSSPSVKSEVISYIMYFIRRINISEYRQIPLV